MSAESAYLFRHALLREAAYQLQLPGDRKRLHGLAIEVLEAICGGKPPAIGGLLECAAAAFSSHPTDRFADDLAEHAKRAGLCEARQVYLRRSAANLQAQFRHDASASRWQEYAELSEGAERGEALRRAAIAARGAGRTSLAERLLDEGRREARQAGNPEAEALNLAEHAFALYQAGRGAESELEFRRALELHCDRHSRAGTLQNFALLLRDRGRMGESRDRLLEALAEFRGFGDRAREALAIRGLAHTDLALGRMDAAEEGFREAVAISFELRDRHGVASALDGLSQVCSASGRRRLAERLTRRALRLYRELGDRATEAVCLSNLATLSIELGDAGPSRDLIERALAIHHELGDRRAEAIALSNLANIHQVAGRTEEAIRLNELALALHREHGSKRMEAVVLGNLASLRFGLGQFGEAETLFSEGLAALREVGFRRGEGALKCDHARMLLLQGRAGEARDQWREGASILRAARDSHLLAMRTREMREACAEAGVPPFDEASP